MFVILVVALCKGYRINITIITSIKISVNDNKTYMHNSVTYDRQLAIVNANYVKYNDIIDISKLNTCKYATVMPVKSLTRNSKINVVQ